MKKKMIILLAIIALFIFINIIYTVIAFSRAYYNEYSVYRLTLLAEIFITNQKNITPEQNGYESFHKYMKNKGWHFTEQLGSMFSYVQKGKHRSYLTKVKGDFILFYPAY